MKLQRSRPHEDRASLVKDDSVPRMLVHAPELPHLGNNVTAHDDLPCLRAQAVVIPAQNV